MELKIDDHEIGIDDSGAKHHVCTDCHSDHVPDVHLPKNNGISAHDIVPEKREVPPGEDPGYYIPESGIANGLPRGGKWKNERMMSESDITSHFRLVQSSCRVCFPDSIWSKRHYIDSQDTNTACKLWRDNLLDVVKYHTSSTGHSYAAFGGNLIERYPKRASTDTISGPASLTYEFSWTATKSTTITNGHSLGGSIGFSFGPLEIGFNGEYNYSISNTHEFSQSSTESSTFPIASDHHGRIDSYEISGLYDGHLFLSLEHCPRDSDGRTYHNINGMRTSTTYYLLVFPMRGVILKSPNSPSPFFRVRREWLKGTPAPQANATI